MFPRHRGPLATLGALGLTVALLAGTVASSPAGAAAPESERVADLAVPFLVAAQQPDGGLHLLDASAGGNAFETPDATLAVAEAAQTGDTWNEAEALAAVEAVRNDEGRTPLDALDDLAESPDLGASLAAKLIVLNVAPLGFDATDFDPSGDSDGPVDLVAVLDAAEDGGRYGAFNATLYAGLVRFLLDGEVPTDTRQVILDAQQANGGWGFLGDPGAADIDPDTTGLAVEALIAAGVDPGAPEVRAALRFLADNQVADGSFPSFGEGNPNSTALGIFAIAAAGFDPASSCWRDVVAPERAGTPYASPDAYLRSTQTGFGNLASPSDSFGVNTFATSQGVQGLLRRWRPVAPAARQACPPDANEAFVEAVYDDLLGRPVDDGGLAFYSDRLDAGADRRSFVDTLLRSGEYRRAVVRRFYDRYLDRPGDPGGVAFASDRLVSGVSSLAVQAELVASGEYHRRAGGEDGAWLDAAYRDALNREADPGGRDFYRDQLAAGRLTRGQVANALFGGAEGLRNQVRRIYDDGQDADPYPGLLGRPADAGGIDFYAGRLRTGTPVEGVLASVASSGEYFVKAGRR